MKSFIHATPDVECMTYAQQLILIDPLDDVEVAALT